MASVMNEGGNGGSGGVLKKMGLLRVQYYCVLGAMATAIMLATLCYMPASIATGTGVWSFTAIVAVLGGGGEYNIGAGASGQRNRKKKMAAGWALLNFGDSNSETGRAVAAVMGIHITPPEGRTYFHHPTEWLSDDRVIFDFICEFSTPFPLPPLLTLELSRVEMHNLALCVPL